MPLKRGSPNKLVWVIQGMRMLISDDKSLDHIDYTSQSLEPELWEYAPNTRALWQPVRRAIYFKALKQ
jgi:hypothetical protein